MIFEPSSQQDDTVKRVLDAAFIVHRELGCGLLESVYETCMMDLLLSWKMKVVKQKPFPVTFMGKVLETGFRADLVVNDDVIVELKSIEKLLPIHEAQIMTYLRLSGINLGLILNFNVPLMKQGIKRIIVSQNRGDLGVRGV
jgi:GxxExxY protein